jgi:hypothetical protein
MAPKRRVALLVLLAATVASAALLPGPSWGMAGVPRGYATVEPVGWKGATLDRVVLTLDLRPLADGKPITVSAEYEVRASKPETTLSLRVPSSRQGPPTLDGAELSAKVDTGLKETEAAWKLPPTVVGLEQATTPYRSSSRTLDTTTFPVVVTHRPRQLRVSYQAQPPALRAKPVLHWQVVHLLEPLRQADKVSRLEVEATLPEGWEAVSTPNLERDGDVLKGSFIEVPKEGLVIVARMPPPTPNENAFFLLAGAALVGVLLSVLIGYRVGRRYARTGRAHSGLTIPVGARLGCGPLALGAALAAAFASLLVALTQYDLLVPDSQRGSEFAGLMHRFLAFIVFVFVFVVSLVVASVLILLGSAARSRTGRRPGPGRRPKSP